MVAHARRTAPDECCGVLIGAADRVDEARPAANIDRSPRTRFTIDPRDHFDAIRTARARGVEVIGFYHSHPRSAPVPSATDRSESPYAGVVYAIVGLSRGDPDVRMFRFDDGDFVAVPFVTD